MKTNLFVKLIAGLGLISCQPTPENTATDAFGWDMLTADLTPDSTRMMGMTDCNQFLAAIDSFPWLAQTKLADQLQKVSPTLSVTDLLTDRTLFISSISTDQPDSLTYYVGLVFPVTKKTWFGQKNYRQVEMFEINKINAISQIVSLFFQRSEKILEKLKYYPYLPSGFPEQKTWDEYLSFKVDLKTTALVHNAAAIQDFQKK